MRLHAGAARLEPARNAEPGRTASLAASLTYGFDHTFTEPDKAQLALLHRSAGWSPRRSSPRWAVPRRFRKTRFPRWPDLPDPLPQPCPHHTSARRPVRSTRRRLASPTATRSGIRTRATGT